MSANSLCTQCQDIFTAGRVGRAPENKQHHADSTGFFRAVEEGCYICSWTWRQCRWQHPQEHGAYDRVHHTEYALYHVAPDRERSVKEESPAGLASLCVYIYTTEDTSATSWLHFFLFPTTTSKCSWKPSRSVTKKCRPPTDSNTRKLGSNYEIRSDFLSNSRLDQAVLLRACRMSFVKKRKRATIQTRVSPKDRYKLQIRSQIMPRRRTAYKQYISYSISLLGQH